MRIRALWVYLLSGALVSWGQQGLRLEATQGDGAFNDVGSREISNVEVVVKDSSDRPVSGAKVTFTLPFSGPGAVFPDGGRELTVTSDQIGVARMAGARSNRQEGRFNIKVTAAANDGRTGSLVVSQSNTSAISSKSRTNKGFLILGLVGGGATAALFALRGGGSSPSTPGAPAVPTSTSLSAGVLTVGAPR
jgi:hypothetical protein